MPQNPQDLEIDTSRRGHKGELGEGLLQEGRLVEESLKQPKK